MADKKCLSTEFWTLFLLGAVALTISPGCTDGAAVIVDDTSAWDSAHVSTPDALGEVGEEDTNPRTCPEGMESCVFCKEDVDCVGVFPQQTLCENTLCDSDFRVCVLESASEGDSCSDGNVCNGVETCLSIEDSLECVADLPLTCTDLNPCNGMETCDPVEGCLPGQPPECDDGDPCNGTESCDIQTGCVEGTPKVCDDGDPCNGTESCDPVDGCVSGDVPDCDDGNVCNGTEECLPGLGCSMGMLLGCNDGDPCNGIEECDPATGCLTAEPMDCDDQDDCTQDICEPAIGCLHLPAHIAGCCDVDPQCDDGNPCTNDWCDGPTGTCHNDVVGGSCDDGNPCTINDNCVAGECTPGQALGGCEVLCYLSGDQGDDGTCPLHLARLLEDDAGATTLSFTLAYPAGALALDTLLDLACSTPEQCTAFNIPSGTNALFETNHTVTLTPAQPALAEGQLEVSIAHMLDPQIAISPAYIEDGMTNGDSHLLSFRFKLKTPLPAPVPVVVHSVQASGIGGLAHATAFADSTIVTATSSCGETSTLCYDGKLCTEDVCNEGTGDCAYPVQSGSCDDSNPCTEGDYCNDTGDCVPQIAAAAGSPCAGADKCNEVGSCDGAGACVIQPDAEVVCPGDPSGCAIYECDPASGVCYLIPDPAGTPCDDNDNCTKLDACDGMGGCVGASLLCDDGQPCTVDSCDPGSGECSFDSDSDMCNDDNPCTVDSCTSQSGCTYQPNDGANCDDADPCTLNDACVAGECTGAWNTQQCGCSTDPDCDNLDDGNACNGEYVCDEGNCIILPESVVTCPAYADNCIQWTCNPTTGLCQSQDSQAGTSCDAGPCVTNGKCTAQGACEGEPVDCDDGDDCTADSCDPVTGCQYTAVPGCDSKFLLCEIHGSLGDIVECPLMLVQESAQVPPPVGVDFQLSWNLNQVQTNGFLDEFCFGEVCVPKELPTCAADGTGCIWGSLSPTGHNIVAVPKELAQWLGVGTLLFFHPTDPFAHFTETLLGDDGSIIADEATFIIARFKLLQNIPAESPAKLWLANAHFGLPSGEQLQYKVVSTPQGRTIVVF